MILSLKLLMRNVTLQNLINLTVQPEFSPVNCPVPSTFVNICQNLSFDALYVCEYLSKPFIRITTVKGVTTIEGIETMFCLWAFPIVFTKQPTNCGLKTQKLLD